MCVIGAKTAFKCFDAVPARPVHTSGLAVLLLFFVCVPVQLL